MNEQEAHGGKNAALGHKSETDNAMSDPVISKVHTEQTQGHETRGKLFVDLNNDLGRPVITFFTSFRYPVAMNDQDVQALEDLLRTLDLSQGIAVMISSPGGSGLAAERMINVLRSYSGTGEYWAIVPGKAKSAATMVCLGASRIFMGPASELGPVDPQIVFRDQIVPVHHVINSYKQLFEGAEQTTGNIEPYLQQLANYDASMISHLETEQDLATDIAVRYLQNGGMLSGKSERKIKEAIKVFLLPQHTKAHGRPIYHKEAKGCGLDVEVVDLASERWNLIYELYIRSDYLVTQSVTKAIETVEGFYFAAIPPS